MAYEMRARSRRSATHVHVDDVPTASFERRFATDALFSPKSPKIDVPISGEYCSTRQICPLPAQNYIYLKDSWVLIYRLYETWRDRVSIVYATS